MNFNKNSSQARSTENIFKSLHDLVLETFDINLNYIGDLMVRCITVSAIDTNVDLRPI